MRTFPLFCFHHWVHRRPPHFMSLLKLSLDWLVLSDRVVLFVSKLLLPETQTWVNEPASSSMNLSSVSLLLGTPDFYGCLIHHLWFLNPCQVLSVSKTLSYISQQPLFSSLFQKPLEQKACWEFSPLIHHLSLLILMSISVSASSLTNDN